MQFKENAEFTWKIRFVKKSYKEKYYNPDTSRINYVEWQISITMNSIYIDRNQHTA
jgi:hypothetical protein